MGPHVIVGKDAEPGAVALTAAIPAAGATSRGEGRALTSPRPPASPGLGQEGKEGELLTGSGGGGGSGHPDFAATASLLSLSLVDVACSYDHFKSGLGAWTTRLLARRLSQGSILGRDTLRRQQSRSWTEPGSCYFHIPDDDLDCEGQRVFPSSTAHALHGLSPRSGSPRGTGPRENVSAVSLRSRTVPWSRRGGGCEDPGPKLLELVNKRSCPSRSFSHTPHGQGAFHPQDAPQPRTPSGTSFCALRVLPVSHGPVRS